MKVSVGFIDRRTFEEYNKARVENPKLFCCLEKATDDLKNDPFCGVKIPKYLWPREYVKNYSIDNLWKYNLPDAWRLIYTISQDDVKIMAILLEWFDHKSYEKRFGYRKG